MKNCEGCGRKCSRPSLPGTTERDSEGLKDSYDSRTHFPISDTRAECVATVLSLATLAATVDVIPVSYCTSEHKIVTCPCLFKAHFWTIHAE